MSRMRSSSIQWPEPEVLDPGGQRRSRAGSALEFFGTKGSLTIERPMLEVTPDMRSDPANAIPQFKGHSAGGPQRVNKAPEPWTEAFNMKGSSDEQFDLHVRNFLDAIKTRQKTIASAEDGHRTAVACHLANISLRTKSMIEWDAGQRADHE